LEGLVDWMDERLRGTGLIGPNDLMLFHLTDDVRDALEFIGASDLKKRNVVTPLG